MYMYIYNDAYILYNIGIRTRLSGGGRRRGKKGLVKKKSNIINEVSFLKVSAPCIYLARETRTYKNCALRERERETTARARIPRYKSTRHKSAQYFRCRARTRLRRAKTKASSVHAHTIYVGYNINKHNGYNISIHIHIHIYINIFVCIFFLIKRPAPADKCYTTTRTPRVALYTRLTPSPS